MELFLLWFVDDGGMGCVWRRVECESRREVSAMYYSLGYHTEVSLTYFATGPINRFVRTLTINRHDANRGRCVTSLADPDDG